MGFFDAGQVLRTAFGRFGHKYSLQTTLNPVPKVCVYLTVRITKLQVQTTFSKPLHIPHSACIHGDLGC
jgi:hypothetical protein